TAKHDRLRVEGQFQNIHCLTHGLRGSLGPGINPTVPLRDQGGKSFRIVLSGVANVEIFVDCAERDIAVEATTLATHAGQPIRHHDHMADFASIVAASLVEMAVEKHAGPYTPAEKQID